VADRFCVDRYEAILVDRDSGERLSPYYSPTRSAALAAEKSAKKYKPDAGADAEVPLAATMEVPPLSSRQRSTDAVPMAKSVAGEVPNAMVAAKQGETACRNAGKRLCSLDEWRTACAGQAGTRFPYGPSFQHGACNIFTEAHPTGLLFGNASVGHTDPRVNLVESAGRTLLQKTGETRSCKSNWGADAIFDMVGNLMEWVSTPDGLAAVGGYYAQSSRNGCEMNAGSSLGIGFWNYTTGLRCCSDLKP
jgi:formylglycine-generating enzyme required for sulfatase activity